MSVACPPQSVGVGTGEYCGDTAFSTDFAEEPWAAGLTFDLPAGLSPDPVPAAARPPIVAARARR